jgi:hypothetical protein
LVVRLQPKGLAQFRRKRYDSTARDGDGGFHMFAA